MREAPHWLNGAAGGKDLPLPVPLREDREFFLLLESMNAGIAAEVHYLLLFIVIYVIGFLRLVIYVIYVILRS